MENLVTVFTDNSRWLRSYESATLTITSPSGKKIWIQKSKVSLMTKEQRELVWRCVGNELIRTIELPIKVTIEEMKLLLLASKM